MRVSVASVSCFQLLFFPKILITVTLTFEIKGQSMSTVDNANHSRRIMMSTNTTFFLYSVLGNKLKPRVMLLRGHQGVYYFECG